MALSKEEAKNLSILDVAHSLGMEMKRLSSSEYYWVEHDSLKINTRKNLFAWYSQDIRGDTISLVETIKGVNYKEAMHFLETGDFPEFTADVAPKEPFRYTLEPYEQPFLAARTYLTEVRGLSDETIDFFSLQGVLAQVNKRASDGYTEPALVFKYLDKEKQVIGASLQGIMPNQERYEGRGYLKQILYNSDGLAGVSVDIGTPNRLVFTEAPIDLMSYYELHKDQLSDVRLVAMDGLKEATISRYFMELYAELKGVSDYKVDLTKVGTALETAAKTTTFFDDPTNANVITLAIDNDKAGREFIQKLEDKGIKLTADLPPLVSDGKKMDWNDYLKQSDNQYMSEATRDNSRLAQARRKLGRLEGELSQATQAVFSHQALTNGQPMNDKRGGAVFFKRQEQLESKAMGKAREIEAQRERVERLEWQEENKARGWNRNGSGLVMSVANIPRIKEAIDRYYAGEHSYTRETIKKYEKQLVELEAMAERAQNTSISPGVQYLIDEGLVTQWAKKPTIYFIKDLRKVAFVLQDNGEFGLSDKYQPKTEEDKEKVKELLDLAASQGDEQVDITKEVQEPMTEVDVIQVEDTKKSLEQTQGISAEGTIGDLPDKQEAAPLPEATRSQPLNDMSPRQTQPQPLLHFNINDEKRLVTKRGYHPISDKDLVKLNRYANSLQAVAQWYLKELADSFIHYLYRDKDGINDLYVLFKEEHFMHLTGVFPYNAGYSSSQALIDIANGKGDFDAILLANNGAAFDKLKVLPELPSILEAGSFYFDDLSTVEKFLRLDLDKAIKSGDKDIALAFRTVDKETLPASLLKLGGGLRNQLANAEEKEILGVFRSRNDPYRYETLSINENYIKDGGKELLAILESRNLGKVQTQEVSQSQDQIGFEKEQIEADQQLDSDGDGISNADEIRLGTDPHNANSRPGKQEEDKQVEQVEMSTVADLIASNDTKALRDHLRDGMRQYMTSDQYKNFLSTMAKFHDYSLNNVVLMMSQNPNIKQVASYQKWKTDFDRQVKKGEKGLKIWVPFTVKLKDENGQPKLDDNGKEMVATRFKFGTVFDVSQTEGKELPKPIYQLESDVLDYENLYRAARQVSKDNGVPISFENIPNPNTNGYFDPANKRIVVADKQLSQAHIMKTIFHEMAHSDLHQKATFDRRSPEYAKQELQAESVAYVVASHYGIDTSDYSFGYLTSWARDPEGLGRFEEQLKVVQEEAKSLINRIDKTLDQLKNKTLVQDKFQSKIAEAKTKQQDLLADKGEPEKDAKKSQELAQTKS